MDYFHDDCTPVPAHILVSLPASLAIDMARLAAAGARFIFKMAPEVGVPHEYAGYTADTGL